MISSRDITAVIIAGGKAQDIPSLLEVEGRKVIERQAQLLKAKVARIEVSVSSPVQWSRFPVVVDQFDPIGPLAGIATALKYASTDYILAIHSRFAWINSDALDLLIARSGEPFDACAVRFDLANPNPLFAIYHKRCAPRAIARIERGDHDAMGLLTSESLAVRWIEDYELQSFDPQLVTFKQVQSPGAIETGQAPEVREPEVPAVVATMPVAFDPGDGSRFAFQSKPAYQTALALVPIAFALAKLAHAELGGQLTKTTLALIVAIAEGAPARSSAFACAAMLDAMRVLGVTDPRLAEADKLLATLVEQLARSGELAQ